MNKKIQKLNNAAVAAILATSSAVVGLPHASIAAEKSFSDLTPANSHYENILELYSRDIISGYPDGTFRPNKEVTRGQAAKMIASILNLDIYNVKNPKFKDVSSTSSYYPYIAALVEQGVISGYVDNTYRPNEIITRNQMAKIIVKGFQFTETTTLNHTFNDVTSKNANRFYIQTLINLGITQGTSAVTFSPSKSVTRGQLASFLIRAEKANVHNASVKEITKIEQRNSTTYVYVNGIKHTVHASLKDIFSVKNTEILKGAHIEGTIVGTEIRGLNNITFNASGAVNNVLTFDGNGATYRGAVGITGNHLKFVNWNVTGEVTIKPATTKAISALHMPLTARTIASLKLASDNIDWGTITPPSELEPDENEGLVEIPTNNKPVLPTLKTVEHNIQFVNVNIRALAITANRTKVTSNKELANVLVAGFVREFELRANVNELYIETDENVTFYGQSDIKKLYKNSYKSLNLYADSHTQLIAVDNKSGWIDLGDYYYVDKIIVPPDSLPHEIFNDFINDSNKIGDIEDPSGKDIDRDPVENVIIPDWEPPNLYIQNVVTQLASMKATVNSTEDGTVYYLIKREIDGEPSIREIMQYTGKLGGNKPVAAGQDAIITVDDLADETNYILYAVAVDEAGNVSKKVSYAFEILDASPPNIDPASAEGLLGGTRIEVSMRPDEPGDYFYYYESYSTQQEEMTTERLLTLVSNNASRTGKGKVTEAGPMQFRITGLEPETPYTVYVVMKDKYGNAMVEPRVLEAVTKKLDLEKPYIKSALNLVDRNTYEFEFEVSKPLDPISANDVNNYELSGTGIKNVNNQPITIKPEKVTYVAGQTKVRIRIPSATGLVNGDTIDLRVLPGVQDTAENPFESEPIGTNTIARNVASYVHEDTLVPKIENLKADISVFGDTAEVTFKANKAGTYYYMIISEDYDWTGIKPQDFYNDFTDNPTPNVKFDNPLHVLEKVGRGGTKPVLVGDQPKFLLDIPVDKADPFKSYSLHIVMRDRSGNVSNMLDVPIVQDKRAPFISKLKVKPYLETAISQGYDDGAKIEFESSEIATMYYKAIPKKIKDTATNTMIPNPELTNFKNSLNNNSNALNQAANNLRESTDASVRRMVNDISNSWIKHNSGVTKGFNAINITSGLDQHTEYEFFFAFEDKYKNLTIFKQSTTNANEYEKYANDGVIKDEVYTDGLYPRVDKIFKKALPFEFKKGILIDVPWDKAAPNVIGDKKIKYEMDKTFKLTFSEALSVPGTAETLQSKQVLLNLQKAIEKITGVGSIEDMEWQNLEHVKSDEERSVVIRFKDELTTDVTLDFSQFVDDTSNPLNISDYAGNTFSSDMFLETLPQFSAISNFKYAVAKGTIQGAELKDPEIISGKKVSRYVNVIAETKANTNYSPVIYYISTQTDVKTLSYEDIDDIISALEHNTTVNGIRGVLVYGKLNVEYASSMTYALDAEGGNTIPVTEGANVISSKFIEGQNLFIFTRDIYGNIIWAYDSNNPANNYLEIK